MRPSMLAPPALALTLALAACSNYKESGGEPRTVQDSLVNDAQASIDRMRAEDPSINRFFETAHAYAVYPEIAKGAIGIGAANGDGLVYEGGRLVGSSTVTQVTVGAQLGGQTFSEIIFFQDAAAFNHFTSEELEFSANASAVAVRSGAAATADYHEGVAVFTLPRGGLMFEASIGGQKFTYRPIE